jgi:hypothetical protein
VAFKLVWSPADDFRSFVLVDDEGLLLNSGVRPSITLAASLTFNLRNTWRFA